MCERILLFCVTSTEHKRKASNGLNKISLASNGSTVRRSTHTAYLTIRIGNRQPNQPRLLLWHFTHQLSYLVMHSWLTLMTQLKRLPLDMLASG